jgi:hypothetical protein
MLIIRRLNCINTASGIVTLCRWQFGAQVAREHVGVLYLFVNCVLLGAVVGLCIDCKNMHGVSNIKRCQHLCV